MVDGCRPNTVYQVQHLAHLVQPASHNNELSGTFAPRPTVRLPRYLRQAPLEPRFSNNLFWWYRLLFSHLRAWKGGVCRSIDCLLSHLVGNPLSLHRVCFTDDGNPTPSLTCRISFPQLRVILRNRFISANTKTALIPNSILCIPTNN